jgi:hypothetical protein
VLVGVFASSQTSAGRRGARPASTCSSAIAMRPIEPRIHGPTSVEPTIARRRIAPGRARDILEGVEVDVEQLIERDGPECVWCGRELWRRDLTLDHVVPRSRGGHMTQENALLACRSCNRRRGARPVDAYVRDRLRDGAEVDVDAVRRSLTRLAGSPRRAHREAAARQLQRLATV